MTHRFIPIWYELDSLKTLPNNNPKRGLHNWPVIRNYKRHRTPCSSFHNLLWTPTLIFFFTLMIQVFSPSFNHFIAKLWSLGSNLLKNIIIKKMKDQSGKIMKTWWHLQSLCGKFVLFIILFNLFLLGAFGFLFF